MDEEIGGSVGTNITIQASDDKHALVTLRVRELIHSQQGRDEAMLVLVTTLFKHLFKPGFSVHSLTEENLCAMVEVPLEFLREEWTAVIENHPNGGGDFKVEVGESPLPLNFPIVVDKDEESQNSE
jgi:hypothetical protein